MSNVPSLGIQGPLIWNSISLAFLIVFLPGEVAGPDVGTKGICESPLTPCSPYMAFLIESILGYFLIHIFSIFSMGVFGQRPNILTTSHTKSLSTKLGI